MWQHFGFGRDNVVNGLGRLPQFGAVLITVAGIVAVTGACRGGDRDGLGAEMTGVSVLDAVVFNRPSLALEDPADDVLATHGDLLLTDDDLIGGFVVEDQWCDIDEGCVTVSGEDPVLFGGKPLSEFVVYPDYRVDQSELEVVDIRALQHPVSNKLRLAIEVAPVDAAWGTDFDRVKVTNGELSDETFLDGPPVVAPGVTSRFVLGHLDAVFEGPTSATITFSDGIGTGVEVELVVKMQIDTPDIERTPTELGSRGSFAVYRSSEELSTSGDDDELLEELIGELVDGGDASALVAPDSPAELVVSTLGGSEDAVKLRRDPDDAQALCWETPYRGAFCERWHSAEVTQGVLTTWSIEEIPIEELVAERRGSWPSTSLKVLRAPVGEIVLLKTTVTNNGAERVRVPLSELAIERDGLVTGALSASGAWEVQAGTTETALATIDGTDLDFDVAYGGGLLYGDTVLSVAHDAEAPSGEEAADLSAETTKLVSLLQSQRFDEAVDLAAPDSSAAEYLEAVASTFPESSGWISDGGQSPGSPIVCRTTGELICSTLEVTSVDEVGQIGGFSVDGRDVEELLFPCCNKETSGGFTGVVEQAIIWPKWGVFVEWSFTNDSDGEVSMETVDLVRPGGVVVNSERGVYEDLRPGRTATGVSEFDADSLEGVLEFRARGRGSVRNVTLAVPLEGAVEGAESNVVREAAETAMVMPDSTTYTLAGQWGESIWIDEQGRPAGVGTPLGRAVPRYKDEVVVLAFSPEFSPANVSSDELVAASREFVEVSDVVTQPVTGPNEQSANVITATIEFINEDDQAVMLPGERDLIWVVVLAGDDPDPSLLTSTISTLGAQLGLSGTIEAFGETVEFER